MSNLKSNRRVKIRLPKLNLTTTEKHLSLTQLIIFGLFFAAIGGYLIYRSFAATNLYVSASGNDANNCSQSAPCRSLNKAYQLAACGDTVQIAGGTYPTQSIARYAPHESCTTPIIFKPVSGEKVTIDGNINFHNYSANSGSSYIVLREVNFSGNIDLRYGAHDIEVRNTNGGAFYMEDSYNILFTGNDWGPCPSNGSCASQTTIAESYNSLPAMNNIVIDGDTFHDFTIETADAHWECMYISSVSGNLTIKNSRFYNCETYAIYFTGFHSSHSYANANIKVENNWFGRTCCFGSLDRNSAINFGGSGVSVSNVLIRYNSFADGQTVVDEGGAVEQNVRIIGNILGAGGCGPTATYAYNLQKGTPCPGIGNSSISSMPYINPSSRADMDYHLNSNTVADNFVLPTSDDYNLAVDIDGQFRSSPREAGSDERASSTLAPTVSLTANPTSITSGQSSTLSWSSTNATSCSASGAWSGAKATSGTESVTPASTSTYSLTCTGSGGNATASVIITVSSTPPPASTPPLKFPAAFHIWGGSMDSAMSKMDFVVSRNLNEGNGPAYWRANGNPNLIALVNNGVDWSFCPNERTFAWTYGGGLSGGTACNPDLGPWTGANDTLSPSPQGTIRGFRSTDYSACRQADGILGFGIDKSATATWIKQAAWYGWKLGNAANKGYNGLWSDNLIPGNLIKAGWFFGSSCPIDGSAWDQGILTIANGLRSLGVPVVGGNGIFRASDPTVRAATNAALHEVLESTISSGPSAFARVLSEALTWQKAATGPRYLAVMDKTPNSDTQRLRYGLGLATIMGGAYMSYQTHSDLYMPAEMTYNGRRNYLGLPTADPVRVGDAWKRTFEGGVVYANMGSSAVIIDDVSIPAKDAVFKVSASSTPPPSTSTISIPARSVSHTVDGNLSESDWNIAYSVSKTVIGNPSASAAFGVVWDNTYLYYGVKVSDLALFNDSTNCWDDDSVEFYIDGAANGGTVYDSNDRQLTKGYLDSVLCGIGASNTPGTLHAVTNIPGGYSVEIAIPWSAIGITPSSNMTIGLDVGLNDDTNGGVRDGQKMWNGTASNFSDPSAFGRGTLIGTPPPADTTPPTVSITAPTAGSTVSGTVTISASASDNVGVSKVEFYIDGSLKTTDTSSPYSYNWDTTTYTNGTHSIIAKAYDAAGNSSSAQISVTVSNGDLTPPSAPTNLTATASAYNKVDLSWSASTDNVGVTGYYIVRNGVTIASTSGTVTTYSDTTVSPSTTYSYYVIARDAAGNASGPSNTASVTTPPAPDTTPPSAPTNLTATAVSSSQINLSWSASTDNVGVTGYDIYQNGIRIATVSTTSYGRTGLSPSTTYSYYVIARDAAGNSSPASNTASATTQPLAATAGNLAGVISSSSGGNLPGRATISLVVNGSTRTYKADRNGSYYISSLPAATYNVTYSAKFHASTTRSATITSGTTTIINVVLQRL